MPYEDWIELTKEDGKTFGIRKSILLEYSIDDKGHVVIKDINGVKTTIKEKMQEFKILMDIR